MLTSRRRLLLSSALGLGTIVLTPAVRALGDPLDTPTPTPTPPSPSPTPTVIPPVSGADGALDAVFAALPVYTGGPLRVVTVIPGTYKRRRRILVPPGVHLIAKGCTFVLQTTGKEDPLLEIRDTRDVVIEGGTWDGNKAIVKAKTEYRHCIRVVNSDRVTLRNLVTQNAKGDGIYIGSQLNPCHDIVLESVRSTKNHRNGLSVTSCDGLLVTMSRFHANGGTAPMSGAVIEPNAEAAVVDNIVFDQCSFDKNMDRGLLIKMRVGSPAPVKGIELRNCDFVRNGRTGKNGTLSGGLVLLRPRLVKVTNGSWISGNQVGVFVQGTRPGDKAPAPSGLLVIDHATIDNNLKDGVFISNRIGHLQVTSSKIVSNSRKKKSRYNGIRIQQGYKVTITDSQCRKHRGYGVRADKKVRGVVITRSVLTGNAKGAIYKKGASVVVVR